MSDPVISEHFMGLLMQLHYTAWVQLGKVANPGSGKVERDLEAAKGTIDVLGALEEKSKGNLHAEEEKLLSRMLLDLRMNYVEEVKQGVPSAAAAEQEAPQGSGGATAHTSVPETSDDKQREPSPPSGGGQQSS